MILTLFFTWNTLYVLRSLITKAKIWTSKHSPPESLLAHHGMVGKSHRFHFSLMKKREDENICPMFRLLGKLLEGLVSASSVSECWWDLEHSNCLGLLKKKQKSKKLSDVLLLQGLHSTTEQHQRKQEIMNS